MVTMDVQCYFHAISPIRTQSSPCRYKLPRIWLYPDSARLSTSLGPKITPGSCLRILLLEPATHKFLEIALLTHPLPRRISNRNLLCPTWIDWNFCFFSIKLDIALVRVFSDLHDFHFCSTENSHRPALPRSLPHPSTISLEDSKAGSRRMMRSRLRRIGIRLWK